jgi:hypothetical protein
MASLVLQFNEFDDASVGNTTLLEMNLGIESVGSSRITEAGEQPLTVVGKDETLYIVGHSGGNKLGGYSVKELAAILHKGGLGVGPLSIGLVACNTGSGHAPFALELKVQLVMLYGIMCAVQAPRGSMGNTLQGDFKVVDRQGHEVTNQPYYETSKWF